ncbi:MAG: GNAT family N-acetyltransferase [Robiginitomaculum sp.]|nr:GNAT family N-acetyltransferase [Robiginitomaculum sp.]
MPKRGKIPNPIYEPCTGGQVYLAVPKWADFDSWVALRRDNRTYLQSWEPSWDEAHLTRSAYRSRLTIYKKMIAEDIGYPFHVFMAEGHKLVGACNLTALKRGSMQSAHIGYWIGERYGRNGFARAAVRAILRFSFEDLRLHRLEAAVQAENAASISVLEKTGFRQEGIARGLLKIDNQWRDHLIFAKLSGD